MKNRYEKEWSLRAQRSNDHSRCGAAIWHLYVFLWIVFGLIGCSQKEDLSAYINRVKSQKTKPTLPPPNVPPITRNFSFKNDINKSPFDSLKRKKLPHTQYSMESLNGHPLEALKFVGTLRRDGVFYGLVMTKEARVFLVHKGQVIDKNNGRIIHIGLKTLKIARKQQSMGRSKNEKIILKLTTNK